ncbi:MAG: pyridoxamine 5'-phosphate oxidase [Myxococcales bacterium]|nr:pyridoxamine 5'-phosphate oxidase [Myxococcales bacterium]USN50178.1 MAG: pyridoxamine 5'-phosphate oxidase [Myxococcales bacterium]
MNMPTPRIEFNKRELDEQDVGADPYALFKRWWEEAIMAKLNMPDAAVFSTVTAQNCADARVVFIKEFDENGFVFYTNYQSAKGQEIAQNPCGHLVLFWSDFERQVRIQGKVVKTDRAQSESYFKTRPRSSQVGAWVSRQSEVLSSRAELESSFKEAQGSFKDIEVPCPPHWGGYCLKPRYFEFWQGRPSRLHDRFCFSLSDSQEWEIQRLYP